MKILFEQDGHIVGVTDEGKYFESYRQTDNISIIPCAGKYIQQLQIDKDKAMNLLAKIYDYCKITYELRHSSIHEYEIGCKESVSSLLNAIEQSGMEDELIRIDRKLHGEVLDE